MPDSLPELERRRAELLTQISHLGDFRPGSITATQGRCGNRNCHCHKPGERAHYSLNAKGNFSFERLLRFR